MITNYEEKLEYISIRQGGCCAIAKTHGQEEPITELHHRLHDTVPNRRRFPLFIGSVFNLLGVNRDHHMNEPYFMRIGLLQADQAEAMLRKYPAIANMGEKPSGMSAGALEIVSGII